jgi:hypothetical protein
MSPCTKSVVELVAIFRDTWNFPNILKFSVLDSIRLNSMDIARYVENIRFGVILVESLMKRTC